MRTKLISVLIMSTMLLVGTNVMAEPPVNVVNSRDKDIAVKAVRDAGYSCERVSLIVQLGRLPVAGLVCTDNNSYIVIEDGNNMQVFIKVARVSK